ncbi:hypothetical protein ATO11_06710 [Pseudaestuariivita atlantica]|uniref:Uncharacterized protein n=1 Tax=Pseudaestuariivita atlantica TaxID=1317121 RepID=A0A0L1JQE7_9RHOB|nr:hypothetical protein ATO11_06710 [Pseudaestuariivita atlantica]
MAALAALAATAAAGEDAVAGLPSFEVCLAREVAIYERTLRHWMAGPRAEEFMIGDVSGIEYCGTVGIVACDRSDAPLPCQRDLAARQDTVSAAVRASLPPASEVAGRAGEWSDALYPQLLALAEGASAGPDCAGQTEVMETWCAAREANARLRDAALAWQLARYLGAAQDAVTAGWAGVPPPLRPRARPEETL